MSQQVLDQISNSRNYKCEKNRQFEVRSAHFFLHIQNLIGHPVPMHFIVSLHLDNYSNIFNHKDLTILVEFVQVDP